jgi:nucleotide-binding universal stress UspA family protein
MRAAAARFKSRAGIAQGLRRSRRRPQRLRSMSLNLRPRRGTPRAPPPGMRGTTIVCATDFSECSRFAVRRAQRLATEGEGIDWVLTYVHDPRVGETLRGPAAEERLAEERNASELRLAGEVEELTRHGKPPRPLWASGEPAQTLIEVARTEAAELLVVGSHGKTGITRLVLGSVAERVAQHSDIPVLVARGTAEEPFRRALVATDFGAAAERALELALRLVAPGATVDVVNAVAIPIFVAAPLHAVAVQSLGELQVAARRLGADLVARHARRGVALRFIDDVGDPRDSILTRLEEQPYDLLATGTHTRRGADRLLLGSVSTALVRHAKCSVLVVR